jgi:hypothetical protein
MSKSGERRLRFISEHKALELLKQQDYLTDLQVMELVSKKAEPLAVQFLEWQRESQSESLPAEKKVSQREYSDADETALEALRELTESYQILTRPETHDRDLMAFKVGAHAVFHLEEAVRTVLVDGLALWMAFAYGSSLPYWIIGCLGVRLSYVCKKVLSCYERLENPAEKQVFETVYRLQNEYSVVHSRHLATLKLDEGYELVSPTQEAISRELEGKMDKGRVESTLYALKQRDILDERGGLWSIRFW